MVSLASEIDPRDRQNSQFTVDWTLVACAFSAFAFVAVTAAAIYSERLDPYINSRTQLILQYVTFAMAALSPVMMCWRRAIADGQLPAKNGAEPKYEHVSGWSAILLLSVMALIAWLVWWAAGSDDANRRIHAEWGTWIVIGLTIAFVSVAAAPLFPRAARLLGLEKGLTRVSSVLNAPIEFVGGMLSALDGILVFAVSNSVGTNRDNFFLRYVILLAAISACAALGYYWPAPWAFVPIVWGFVIAFSVSRRWAWIEGDRELAMLNPTLSQQHIRVGFAQNLRDEALIVFLSMFLLVPLALRQGQLWAEANEVALFTLSKDADVHSLAMWISFYGTELAKAVPFVDWAEVYHVEGEAPVEAVEPFALHAVFATRVLIDLVFLAALLQAITSASRDAQQRDLFYRKRAIKRLDPFVEPEALRGLVRRGPTGDWERNGEKFDDFPHYDANRLVELSVSADTRICRAADFLLERDGVGNDPHHRLSGSAADKETKPDDVREILNEIENGGVARNIYQLALARRRLLAKRSMAEVRARIVKMIALDQQHSIERTERLIEAMVGEYRESYANARRIALDALEPETGRNLRVRTAIRQAAAHDGAQAIRKRAAEILAQNPETPD
ncbi:hypothetical protein [Candidatus Viadribacter manganicus]|uniref:Uncharacterized protein n=1 Tax=Candidatus Viadribacter manganicus TaxID=1759059 RepID=A0A1B1AE55_9PROT|nr:hypothetical protein [Candidatus Viadribacter manganicus]ANP44837.1 hypothetical protein ATE48_02300 [Candidatus Viadribacter manganicus]